MTITLPTEVEAYLRRRVTEGSYAPPEEALIAAVELLREEEAREIKARDELRALLDEGILAADAGRLHALDAAGIEEMIARAGERSEAMQAELRRRGRTETALPSENPNRSFLSAYGAWKGDETALELLQEIYRNRGRAVTEDEG